jgi:beta-lactamase class A
MAGDDAAAQVHLGANFPLRLTLASKNVDGKIWYQATWQTPGRYETGWLPSSAFTLNRPSGEAAASLDALDTALAAYLAKLGTRVGVVVADVTRGVTYSYNGSRAFYAASSMKVPIMFTLLSQLEAKRREPTGHEMSLLTTMIEFSNNKSAKALYDEIGAQAGIKAFMRQVGISGLSPAPAANGWGYSTITPAAMVALLKRLNAGTILTAAHRALALRLMTHVIAHQRVGVGDSSPAGATIALKDGWVQIHDGSGTSVMNSSGIVTLDGETYVIAVYTDKDRSFYDGFIIARYVCRVVGDRLVEADKNPQPVKGAY